VRAATQGGKDRAAREGGKDRAAAEGGKDRAATEGGKDRAATEGGKDRAATEGGKDRAATEGGPYLRFLKSPRTIFSLFSAARMSRAAQPRPSAMRRASASGYSSSSSRRT